MLDCLLITQIKKCATNAVAYLCKITEISFIRLDPEQRISTPPTSAYSHETRMIFYQKSEGGIDKENLRNKR